MPGVLVIRIHTTPHEYYEVKCKHLLHYQMWVQQPDARCARHPNTHNITQIYEAKFKIPLDIRNV